MLVNNTIESSRRPGIPGPHRPDLKWFKEALDGKSDVGHVHQKKDITDFEHDHDGRYYRKDEHELQLLLSGNGTPNFNQGINGDYYVDELNGDLYKKSGDAWNLIIHLEGEQGIPGPQGNPGIRGPEGPTGKEGYTPVRGTDYWTPEDEEIIRQSIVSEVQLGLSGKVDKVEGKGLSTEDFTTLLKQKLEELQNYDDRDIRELLEKALYNVTIDVKTGILTFHTIDESSFTVDLPLELIVSDGYLNKATNTIVLVLANGNTIDIPVENLIKDFYSKSEVDQKIEDLAEEIAIDFEAVAEDFNKVDEELAKAQAQIDALKAENEAQQKELDILYNDLVPGEASGETAVVANGVTGSKVEIDGDGNTVQEVIEAVEGTTVVDTNMNLTDVDTTFENSLLPMGNISQETREAYQLLSTDEANLTVVQGSDATHLQYYDDGFINAFNNVTDAETELIYTIPTKHITSGKKYTLGIEYKYTNRASIYLRNAANDDSVKALNTNSASSIKLTNTANSDYMSVSVILKANASATFRLTLAEGTEQKPWQAYDPDYVIPSLNYPSPVKGVGGQSSNILDIPSLQPQTAYGVTFTPQADGGIKIQGTPTSTVTVNYDLRDTSSLPAGDYTFRCIKLPDSCTTDIYNGTGVKFGEQHLVFNVDGTKNNKITVGVPVGVTVDTTVYPLLVKGKYSPEFSRKFAAYGVTRYFEKINNKNIAENIVYYSTKNVYAPTAIVDYSVKKGKYYIVSCDTENTGQYIYVNAIESSYGIIRVSSNYAERCDGTRKFWVVKAVKDFHLNRGNLINKGAYNNDPEVATGYTYNVMMEEIEALSDQDAATKTPSEYIEEQHQLLPIDIPVGQEWYSGKPYKLNGKWYRDVEWEKLYGKDLPWYFQNNENIDNINTNRFTYTIPTENADSTSVNAYSNILPANTAGQLWINDKLGVARSISQVIVRVPAEITTKEQVQEYFGEDGYIVCKKTPTREEITDTHLIEQLEELQNAEFYDGVTNINSYKSSEDVAEMPLEAHYNFITPAPSPDRDSEVEIAETPNMFNSSYFKEETSNGITLTQNEDGTVTLNGTSTGNTMFRILRTGQTLPGTGNEKLTIFPLEGTLSSGDLKFIAQDTNYAELRYAQIGTATLNQKLKPNVNYNIFALTFTTGAVCKNLKLGLVIGSDISHFVPYGHIGLVQSGKNMFKTSKPIGNSYTSNGVVFTIKSPTIIHAKGTATGAHAELFLIGNTWEESNNKYENLKIGKDYTVSMKVKTPQIYTYWINGKSNTVAPLDSVKSNKSFIATEQGISKLLIRVFQGVTVDEDIELQLEPGNVATEIEPYIEPKIQYINLQGNKLAKLPSGVKDNLLIGLDGKCSIDDKLIKEYTFTGDENWIRYDAGNYAVFYADILTDSKKVASYPYCNYLKAGNYVAANDKVIMIDKNGRVHIRIDKFKTVNELKTFLKQNTVKILYPLEIPETINLPSIKPIELFEGTNVFELITSLPTTLTAHYKVSSKKQLIENNDRITALEATVNTLLGGN